MIRMSVCGVVKIGEYHVSVLDVAEGRQSCGFTSGAWDKHHDGKRVEPISGAVTFARTKEAP